MVPTAFVCGYAEVVLIGAGKAHKPCQTLTPTGVPIFYDTATPIPYENGTPDKHSDSWQNAYSHPDAHNETHTYCYPDTQPNNSTYFLVVIPHKVACRADPR